MNHHILLVEDLMILNFFECLIFFCILEVNYYFDNNSQPALLGVKGIAWARAVSPCRTNACKILNVLGHPHIVQLSICCHQ